MLFEIIGLQGDDEVAVEGRIDGGAPIFKKVPF